MLGRGAVIAALSALLLALILAPGTSAGKKKFPAPPADFYGVDSVHEPDDREFRLMAKTGVEVYRMPMLWRSIERKAPTVTLGQTQRTYDWRATDRYMRLGATHGVALQVGLNSTPSWVAVDKRTSPMQSAEGRVGWRAFIAAVIARYGPTGDFWGENPDLPVSPPIAYQVWNEQNTTGRYQPKADPAEYGALLRIAGSEIRAVDPDVQVMPGGMFGTPQTPDSFSAWTFMRKLLLQPGVRQYVDAVAIHPYSPDLRGIKYQFRKMRKTLAKSKARKMPMQVTELGWSSGTKDSFFFFKGRKGQARLLKKSFALMHRKRKAWKLERLIWFNWRDVDKSELDGTCGFCSKFGLLETDLTPKPSYRQYKKFSRRR